MKGAPPLPSLIQVLYKTILQPGLFMADPERAHEWAASKVRGLEKRSGVLRWLEKNFVIQDERLRVRIGEKFAPNPIGLGAGFDKAGDLFPVLSRMGFGFIETGTFTPLPQPGNPKPRLFRYKPERALVNRMGFNNPGIHVLPERFQKWDDRIPIGVNVGKNKATPVENALDDYEKAFVASFDYADYVTVNVSSPNTPNLRDLQAVESLESILSALDQKNQALAQEKGRKPRTIFVKVAPDLSNEGLTEVAKLAVKKKAGLIATNTTLDHSSLTSAPDEAGGLSGAPLRTRANEVLTVLFKETQGDVPLIGVGGIDGPDAAYEKIRLGANALQIYTGWIYNGPDFVPNLNKGILRRLEKDGFRSISEAVGTKTD